MIRRMRLKFVGIAMTALILMLLVIYVTVKVALSNNAGAIVESYIDAALEIKENKEALYSNSKGLPHNQALKFEENIFFVEISKDLELIEVLHNPKEHSKKYITAYIQEVLKADNDQGVIENYSYGKKVTDNGKFIVVFIDTSIQKAFLSSLIQISYIIGGISAISLFVLIIYLSKYITKPVEVAFEKQKRFIADSSHELKTPLSIMSANLDMLQMEIGENERLRAMNEGIYRMNGLIHELLTLVRTEQNDQIFKTFNLSELFEKVILPFDVVAFENGNMIECTIEENVMINGNEEGIQKLISALMENAIKYSKEKTIIKASLCIRNRNKVIEVFNEGIGVSKEQREKLFDKFYRVDDSRQRATGGYGIGLSIVKSVVEVHKGEIIVESVPDEFIVFRIKLP